MEALFQFLGIVFVTCGAVFVGFLFLLNMPHSPLRNFLMDVLKRLMATGAAGAYALSPIDIIPDFIPLLGQADDLTVLILMLYYWMTLIQRSPESPKSRARTRPESIRPSDQVIDID